MVARETTAVPTPKDSMSAFPPFSFIARAHSASGIKVRITDSLPQRVPQVIKDTYGPKIDKAKSFINDTWKVNTRFTTHRTITGRTVLDVNVRPSTYGGFYALGRTDMRPDVLDLVRHAGASASWITKDNMIMFQFRSNQNKSFPEWFGSGASGSVDGRVNGQTEPGDWNKDGTKLDPISPYEFRRTAIRETKEETGLKPDWWHPTGRLKLMGVLRTTTQKPIDEFVFVGYTSKTSEQIIAKQNKALAKNGDTHESPIDKIGFIEASPQAIEALTTQVDSPLIPTALGTMLLTGYYLTFKEAYRQQPLLSRRRKHAQQVAREWLDRVSNQAFIHYAELEARAREYNATFNANRPPGSRKRLEELDPWFTPEEQNLKSGEEAMKEAGLYFRRDGRVHGERQFTKSRR